MVNRINRSENRPGLSLEFLESCQGIYSCTQAMNQMSVQAETLFGDCKTTDEVYKRAGEIYNTSDEEKKLLVGSGANYTAFKLFLSQGDISTAAEMIRMLVSKDNIYNLNNKAVSELGLSLERLCMEEQELLSPERLDYLMFSRYAKESIALHNCHEDKEGLAIISQELPNKNYHARFILELYTGKQIKIDKPGIVVASGSISISGGGFNTNAPLEPTKKFCLDILSKSGVKESGIILTNNHNFVNYIAARYTFNRIGKMVHIGTPLRRDNKPKWV